MNFLAHLYLSGKEEEIIIGNFIGDFVKGSDFDHLNDGVTQGIILHRAIDEFTDSHKIVQLSKERLRPKYRHYAGVIVDIYYDHFLALLWQEYHDKDLRVYVNYCYELLEKNIHRLPAKTQKMLPFMISHDWLYNYQYFEGIQKVMHGMAHRTKFNSLMEQSVVELKQYHKQFEEEFRLFFPDLQRFSKEFIQKL